MVGLIYDCTKLAVQLFLRISYSNQCILVPGTGKRICLCADVLKASSSKER